MFVSYYLREFFIENHGKNNHLLIKYQTFFC